jgi:transaldolase
MLTVDQVRQVAAVLDDNVPAIASVFAGRIADTGRDPMRVMCEALGVLRERPQVQLLWASVREVLNIAQANDCGCHIVTVAHDILAKAIKLWDMDLEDLSLETVKMFAGDAEKAGYQL